MKNIASIILRAFLYFLYIIVVIVAFSIITGLILSLFEKCNPIGAKAEVNTSKVEWRCKAVPPEKTRFKKDIEILAFHEERNKAEKNAIWFCNKIFKTNKCKIDSCKQVKVR